MRSDKTYIDTNVREILPANPARRFVQFRNEDAALTVLFQTGPSPGNVDDFFECRPGEVFTYDPQMGVAAMVQSSWWMVCTGGTPNFKMIVG